MTKKYILILTPLPPPHPLTLTARDGGGLQFGDGAQQAVLRPVQLPLRPFRGAPDRRGGAPPPARPLLPLRPFQVPHGGGAPLLRGGARRGEAGDGRGGVQVRNGKRGEGGLGTPVTFLEIRSSCSSFPRRSRPDTSSV